MKLRPDRSLRPGWPPARDRNPTRVVPLPVPTPTPLLALGSHLAHGITLAKGDRVFLGPVIRGRDAIVERARVAITEFGRAVRVNPEAVVHDCNPRGRATRLAHELGLPLVPPVQHHHAHVAAVLAEHGRRDPVLGVAFDGAGYGEDGALWGSEIMLADLTGYRRLAHLRYVPLPGGPRTVREPWRAALAYASMDHSARSAFALAFRDVPDRELAAAERQIETGVDAPASSSMGCLFDAAASVLGIRHAAEQEGQAAKELEALAARRVAAEYNWRLEETPEGIWVMDPLPLLSRLGHLRQKGRNPAELAADFHASVAWMTVRVVARAAEATGVTTVVLTGGVFQNARLRDSISGQLERFHYEVLTPELLPPGGAGVAYGQTAVTAARLTLT